jgi:hypothetical protein
MLDLPVDQIASMFMAQYDMRKNPQGSPDAVSRAFNTWFDRMMLPPQNKALACAKVVQQVLTRKVAGGLHHKPAAPAAAGQPCPTCGRK